jgi:excisionase family DNA binding protein
VGEVKEHPGNFVTVPRAAEIAGVSVRTIGRMIADGTLKAVKPRGHWRVSLASLRKLMSAQPAEPELEYDPLLR